MEIFYGFSDKNEAFKAYRKIIVAHVNSYEGDKEQKDDVANKHKNVASSQAATMKHDEYKNPFAQEVKPETNQGQQQGPK